MRSLTTIFALFCSTFIFTACNDDSFPEAENEEELITAVTLTFTPTDGGIAVIANASDTSAEDGNTIVAEKIVLEANTNYELSIELDPAATETGITEQIIEEADEHLLLFAWTEGLFSDPEGDGNIDERDDPVNYGDFDANGLPLGLETTWTTGEPASGTFRFVLKHQPDIKSATSGINDGATDLDVIWDIEITE
ncbi:hypothetical protein [Nafulsella turpanensis]|uniref:hypothetical protein n=1 Tax=Nafulsella turpanensis TaxID=1265690 RepID=UPI000349141C|nr:hypothetical protein [Nafulsella turpanensis]